MMTAVIVTLFMLLMLGSMVMLVTAMLMVVKLVMLMKMTVMMIAMIMVVVKCYDGVGVHGADDVVMMVPMMMVLFMKV